MYCDGTRFVSHTIVSGILPASGYKYGSLFNNTWYTPEDDEKLIEAVNKLKNK